MSDWQSELEKYTKGKEEEAKREIAQQEVQQEQAERFIHETVAPAFVELKAKLTELSKDVRIRGGNAPEASLEIWSGNDREFEYEISSFQGKMKLIIGTIDSKDGSWSRYSADPPAGGKNMEEITIDDVIKHVVSFYTGP